MWGFFVLQKHFIMSWFVYILQSEKDGDYYKGITENIELRLKQHNTGQSTFTSTKMPWQLLYSKETTLRRLCLRKPYVLRRLCL